MLTFPYNNNNNNSFIHQNWSIIQRHFIQKIWNRILHNN